MLQENLATNLPHLAINSSAVEIPERRVCIGGGGGDDILSGVGMGRMKPFDIPGSP